MPASYPDVDVEHVRARRMAPPLIDSRWRYVLSALKSAAEDASSPPMADRTTRPNGRSMSEITRESIMGVTAGRFTLEILGCMGLPGDAVH